MGLIQNEPSLNRRVQHFLEALERQGIIAAGRAGIKPQLAERLATLHLRFDKEALRFVADVQSALQAIVPGGRTLVFTITAPIRSGSKTAAALAEELRRSLAPGRARFALEKRIKGNQIRVRLVKDTSNGARAIGFVHNPASDPEILFAATQSLLRRAP